MTYKRISLRTFLIIIFVKPLLLVKVVVAFSCLLITSMNENIVNAIIIDGNTYNVLPNGVKCPDCAVRDYCLKGKLGSAVTFDCASIHLEIAS